MKYQYLMKFAAPLLIITLITVGGCKKFLDVGTPVTKISTETAYNDNLTATAVITGLYTQLSYEYINGTTLAGSSFYEELSADNLTLFDKGSNFNYTTFYENSLEPKYAANLGQSYWLTTYKLLYTINTSIDALKGNSALKPKVKNRLLGETLFMRAFCYFYLVNYYGDVPLILTGDYTLNSKIGRAPSSEVYKQIISDLKQAEELLDYSYAGLDVTQITNERLRPNLGAVNALLSRVYLYTKNYEAAEETASKLISQSAIYSIGNLDEVFVKNSQETIWALQPVTDGFNTLEGAIYLLPPDGPDATRPVYISTSLLSSFEPGDDRKIIWINEVTAQNGDSYFYPAKYKVPFLEADAFVRNTEYTIVFRLAEQYLIRSEARNEMGNTKGAMDDLNVLRSRSRATPNTQVPNPLPELSSLSQVQLRTVILKDRRVELFGEWAHRWFDLRRSGTMDDVMKIAATEKGGIWSPNKKFYPIPLDDILKNPALKQNSGF